MLRTPLRLALVLGTLTSLVAVRAPAEGGSEMRVQQSAPPSSATGLPAALADAIRPVVSVAKTAASSLRPAAKNPVRILLLSSGINASVFPESLRSSLHGVSGGWNDAAGYGTYATTVLLQTLASADLTSFSIYSGEKFDAGRFESALGWALERTSAFDAILFAAPPSELLDPATLLMSTATKDGTEWGELLTAVGDHPYRDAKGRAIFGVATDGETRRDQFSGASATQRRAAERWTTAVARWDRVRARLRSLEAKGLPLVVPAGDLGPNFQTIFGIANLPEVVTVGAFDGRGAARTSASGPSIDNRVKPDLIAPGNLAGLLPKGTTLAERLPVDPTIQIEFPNGEEPAGGERVRVDSTIPAAAVVAAQLGTLTSGGISDAGVLRGALTMGARPVSGVPVWRQGAGALARLVSAREVTARGVALGFGDFGAEPERGAWTSRIGFWNTRALGARTTLTGFSGLAPAGIASGRSMSDANAVSAGVGNDGVTLTTGMGERWQGGLYCGYTAISIPGTSSDVEGRVSSDGLPPGLREHVPTCLLNGSRVVTHGFYIHDEPAEDLTFALIPDVPKRDALMSGIPKHLPVDPFSTRLYQKVTAADGNAVFTNVPPAYYRIRQFSDYGNPVAFRVQGENGEETRRQELGRNPSYQDVPAFVFGTPGPTEKDLQATFGADRVHKEKPTGGYLVDVAAGEQIRFVLGWMKKMPGPAVASRYIDLISRDDLTFAQAEVPDVLTRLSSAGAGMWPLTADGWLVSGVNAPAGSTSPEEIVARYNSVHGTADLRLDLPLGIAQYPFALTQPNYLTDLSIDFEYDLHMAAIAVIVQIGAEVATGVVADTGVLRFEGDANGDSLLARAGIAPSGTAGKASFGFELHSHNLSSGTITFVFVPAEAIAREAAPLARVEMRNLGIRVSTWQRDLWPATMTPAGMGHAFTVRPNVSAAQMNRPECRTKTVASFTYDECEEWTVMVHSPGEDAATVAVRSDGKDVTGALAAAGGVLFDPRRGTTDFSSTLLASPEVLGAVRLEREMRTNGRFWEQLAVPLAFTRAHPGPLRFEILDNARGRDSTLFPHTPGGVAVGPYIPFAEDRTPSDLTQPVNDLAPRGMFVPGSVTASGHSYACELI